MLYDDCVVGESKYGAYFLYAVRNGDGRTEYSFFAPEEVHSKLKDLRKGDKLEITKLAEQKGTKIITKYEVKPLPVTEPVSEIPEALPIKVSASNPIDRFYELMLLSCRDAVRIQTELGGLMDAKTVAVTLFIARSKTNN